MKIVVLKSSGNTHGSSNLLAGNFDPSGVKVEIEKLSALRAFSFLHARGYSDRSEFLYI